MRMGVMNLEILHKSRNIVIVNKPAGMPSQKDKSGDEDVMSLLSEQLRNIGERGELWLIHRLDRVVSGLLVFARNKKSAGELSELVQNGGIGKEYLAVVEGEAEGGILRDFIYKDSAKAKAFVTDRARAGVKEASLEYIPLMCIETERGKRTLVKIKLHTGRFHQIRAQFASRRMPIVGDGKYGSRDNLSVFPALMSFKLSIKMKSEKATVKALPDTDSYPWSLFGDEDKYKELVEND